MTLRGYGLPVLVATLVLVASCSDERSSAPTGPEVYEVDLTGSFDQGARDPIAERIVRGGSLRDYPAENRYIVRLPEGTTDVGDIAEAMLRDIEGTKLHYVYERTIQGFSATIPAHAVDGVRSSSSVRSVSRVGELRFFTAPSWGLARINQRQLSLPSAYDPAYKGDSVHVYVIDTGIRASHSEFGGRAWTRSNGFDAYRPWGHDYYAEDCYGNWDPLHDETQGLFVDHGTHVAGIIGGGWIGVAPWVSRLVSVTVAACGPPFTDAVIAGVEWLTDKVSSLSNPAVANMSMGIDTIAQDVGPMEEAIASSIAAGIVYVAAAGNDNEDACGISPARMPEVISVAASDSTDVLAVFSEGGASNYGSCVDIIAPGVNIISAVPHVNEDTTCSYCTEPRSGTSAAAPHVAGIAVLVRQEYPSLLPAQVRDTIIARATPGVFSGLPTGTPNLLAFTPRKLYGVSIEGADIVYDTASVAYEWIADVVGGDEGDYDYEWARRWNYPSWLGPWIVVSTDVDYEEQIGVGQPTFELRLRAISGSQYVEDYLFITTICEDECAYFGFGGGENDDSS